MDKQILRKHIAHYKEAIEADREKYATDIAERRERAAYYQSWTAARLATMDEAELYEFLSKLWAMRIWGNKHYVVDELLSKYGIEYLRKGLAALMWGTDIVVARWDRFRASIKGIGPAMISEILCHAHPKDCMIWNRRAYVALDALKVATLPRYDYQVTGTRYCELSKAAKAIAVEMEQSGLKNADLLTVDYFFWDELQGEANLSQLHTKGGKDGVDLDPKKIDAQTAEFIHDEVKNKLRDIGKWLGFEAQTERKVADGSVVDTVWEATIGNMGRVVYVFEVQTKGSIDSLIVNLLKALNNPAVQGVVAVSDVAQLEKIKKHASPLVGANQKLKYWDYTQVLQVHSALQGVNESINGLGLVPVGYF